MAKATYIQKGEKLNYTNATLAKIAAGDIVVIGSKVAVAACDIEVGQLGSVTMNGVFEFPITTLAVNMGEKVYWNDTSNSVTKTDTDVEIGYAVETVEDSATKISVKLVG